MKSVIIVDDDSFFAEIVSVIIKKLGFFPILCFRIETALELIEKSDIHFIITDIFMPGIGGIEGIKKLRAKYPESRIIAMSGGWEGMSPEDTIKAATKTGADAGLMKPFSTDDLKDILESLGL